MSACVQEPCTPGALQPSARLWRMRQGDGTSASHGAAMPLGKQGAGSLAHTALPGKQETGSLAHAALPGKQVQPQKCRVPCAEPGALPALELSALLAQSFALAQRIQAARFPSCAGALSLWWNTSGAIIRGRTTCNQSPPPPQRRCSGPLPLLPDPGRVASGQLHHRRCPLSAAPILVQPPACIGVAH